MQRRPTMRDVAAAAGVSVKTVSRVVNDEAAVRDVVADRVRVAIDLSATAPTTAPSCCAGWHGERDDRLRPARRLQPVLLGDLPRTRGRRLGTRLRRRRGQLGRHP